MKSEIQLMINDNPDYITIVFLYGAWHVNKMVWDTRADAYLATISRQVNGDRGDALVEAHDWARKEALEVRA